MDKMKRFIIAVMVMLFSSIISLVLVSALAYFLKWQADKAMVGIIITYVLAGFAGGSYLRKDKKMEIGKNVIEAVLVSTIFIFLLQISSWICFQILFQFSSRFLLIWLLVTCSIFGGMCVVKK